MSEERKQSVFVVAYKGQDTADQVYGTLRGLQKQKKVKIKKAAVITRKKNGKLKVVQKKRLTAGKAALAAGGVGLLMTGPLILPFAAVGALAGAKVSKESKRLKEFLDNKLGQDDSVLGIEVTNADWDAIRAATESVYGRGEVMAMELTAEDEAELNALADKEEVAAAVADEVEVEDDPEVEVVEEED